MSGVEQFFVLHERLVGVLVVRRASPHWRRGPREGPRAQPRPQRALVAWESLTKREGEREGGRERGREREREREGSGGRTEGLAQSAAISMV